MGMLTDLDEGYTKTGKGSLGRISNFFSYLPPLLSGLQKIPGIGLLALPFTAIFGYADTLVESARWLFRGKLGSALTVAAAGAVSTTVNSLTDTATWWGGNALSGALTGATLGTHARAATETVIGSITGALGMQPQVLASYPAGIGSIRGSAAPQGPGKFASSISQQRGEDANAAYERYTRGAGGVHVNELQSANGLGA